MQKIINWIQMMRPANLLILGVTMYFINQFILLPVFDKYGLYFTLNSFQFFLLVLSTLLICAGGYIINDYYDVESDAINKPHRHFIGKSISTIQALRGYWLLTGVGVLLGLFLAIKVGNIRLVTIHGIAALLLYFYSASYKRMPLLGNVVVALLIAISILLVGAFEPAIYKLVREGDYYAARICWNIILGYALFAFLINVARELIKDLEDMEGDGKADMRTTALAWGQQTVKIIAASILFSLILFTTYLLWIRDIAGLHNWFLIYGILLIINLLGLIGFLFGSFTKKAFHRLSVWIKLTMILGILFMPLYYFGYYSGL
ncbi:MAG: geranylgeranylglycerol-phosphate geranylgeranyltransferase [Bacteroidetes bacterium]|nr:geranylgeranylglycerol-phosphate geranylgeranyltransferase [Bacteroidota bacterium]MBP7400410.1 geranylgeranylglycerol-phosphate geranylgeranyltransferase [Chitinophagales bacterium]MBK8487491.1 geranylgeranylglycerol-phosphate geranylgeranyltransferase [Bacteroidota bacterium]MBK8682767.1 geranylgeranylglycerol-phosphate geranylgeranyltransferase [Bacteroidota bacterium]MBP8752942.1 geranylgeranylglycerol-phosphate geranylgeranyltransferase [Chitinophagales bacterium]